MSGERPVVFGFAEVALVLVVLRFFAASLALAVGLGSGIGSFLLFWGSYSVAVFAVVYLVRCLVGRWGLRGLGICGGIVE